jgi:hypothetical protein
MPIISMPYAGAVQVDTDDLLTVLRLVGFPESTLDVAQAVAQAESQCYEDAVGDITLVTAKFGPSVGLFQIRSLRSPQSFGASDRPRIAFALRNRFYNASAALTISKGGTDWSAWSTFANGSHTPFLGQAPQIRTGHSRADDWWR